MPQKKEGVFIPLSGIYSSSSLFSLEDELPSITYDWLNQLPKSTSAQRLEQNGRYSRLSVSLPHIGHLCTLITFLVSLLFSIVFMAPHDLYLNRLGIQQKILQEELDVFFYEEFQRFQLCLSLKL